MELGSQSVTRHDEAVMNYNSGWHWKEVLVNWFKVLCLHSPGRLEESNDKSLRGASVLCHMLRRCSDYRNYVIMFVCVNMNRTEPTGVCLHRVM
jgi:hypothetical protein